MTSRGVLLLLLVTLTAAPCVAQRTVTVVDAETGVPLRDVRVFVNGDDSCGFVTGYTGELALPDSAVSLKLCHPKYERLMVETGGVGDTIALLPNMRRLNELVVTGHRPQISPSIFAGVQTAVASVPRPASVSFDFFELFRWKKRKKQRQRMEAIEDY